MVRLRALIRPSLISPRTKLIGVPAIGFPAVITLKIPFNHLCSCMWRAPALSIDISYLSSTASITSNDWMGS